MSNNIILDAENNDSDTNIKKIKKTRNKLTKKQQFVKEREQIINQLNNILGISQEKNTFYLYDIVNSEETKNKIHSLEEDIKKYFKCGTWYYFKTTNNDDAQEIGLIRNIYKDEGWLMTKKDISLKIDDKRHRTTQYYLFKK